MGSEMCIRDSRDIIQGFNKIRNHFGINRIAQIGALASVKDKDFLNHVKQAAESGRQRVMNVASELGLHAEPSSTNFVAVELDSTERAQGMIAKLADHDVFMRMPGVAPLNRCVRVGLGSDEEFEIFVNAFKQAL